MRHFASLIGGILILVPCASSAAMAAEGSSRKPNIVFILCDDLGYAEVGCYGQKKIRTPHIDRLAVEGMRFTQYYSASPVCAPSRCALLTGKHMGHAAVRNNREVKPEGQHPLPAAEVTIAELLKHSGYATGCIGKWGLGPPGSEGDPLKQGFDYFYGYNCQRHAHNHYPSYLWRNDDRIELRGNDGGDTGEQYTHDLFEREAIQFIETHRDRPFFLYVPFTIPHLALQVPEDSLKEYEGQWEDPPYQGGQGYRPHRAPRAAYAAMVTRMDRSVGRIVEKLDELNLSDDTLIVFTSDNGPTHGNTGGADSAFFESAGRFRGLKGSLYEGGVRVPFIAGWPGKIKPGTTSDLACIAYDLLPTFCDVAGIEAPSETDRISLLPTLTGQDEQRKHEFLYWAFPAYGGQQAARLGRWKAVRQNLSKGVVKTELYDLQSDIGEQNDVAASNPEVVERLETLMAREHLASEDFPLPAIDVARGRGRAKSKK